MTKLSLPVGRAGQRERGFSSTHAGIDYGWYYADPTDSQRTYAAAPGKVVQVVNTSEWGGGWGSRVVIEHAPGVLTTYNHYWLNGIRVQPGQRIVAGTYLGQMGNTGDSAGVHLHFELNINGNRVDPDPYFSKDLPGTKPAGGDTTPIPEQSTEDEEDMAKNSGFYYDSKNATGQRVTIQLICNAGSGFEQEYSNGTGNMPAGYNNAIAAAFDTGSFAKITESHADAIKRSLAEVRAAK